MNKPFSPLLLFILLTACIAAPMPTVPIIPTGSPSPLPLFTSSPFPTPTNTATSTPTPTLIPTYTPRPTATPDPAKIILPDSLSWSPDSRWLAYSMTDGTVWLMDIGGFDPVSIPGPQVKFPANLNTVWSPDGHYLLVYGTSGLDYPRWTGMWLVSMIGEGAAETTRWEIRVLMDIARTEPPYFPGESQISFASWSTDGTQIAYVMHREAWVYDLESGHHESVLELLANPLPGQRMAEPFDAVARVAFSPDGTSLAVEVACGDCPMAYTGVGVITLAENREVKLLADGARLVGWSPDGHMTVQSFSNDIFAQYTSDTYNIDPATSELVNLTHSNPNFDPLVDGYENFQPAEYHTGGFQWGPNGQYLYETFYGGPFPEIYTLGFTVHADLDIVLLERTPSPETWYAFPNLAPDGRIAYIEADPALPETGLDTYQLRRVIIDGEVKFEFQPDQNRLASAGVWSPNGLHLALVRPLEPGSQENEVMIWRGLGLDWPHDPTITPGPTPTAAFLWPAANEPACIRPDGLAESRVDASSTEDRLNFCVVWVDDYDNETGFRIVLKYGNGDIFVYEVPANSSQLIVPKEGAPRLGESLEQHLRRTSWQLTVFAIGPDFLATVGGMAADIDSYGIYLLPTATPSPP